MKQFFFVLAVLAATTRLQAQSNSPVRLAIVPETFETGTAADVLTAEFTKNSNVHLLERAEIERVYREQGLSAANRDDLKLGRLLGADGLLFLGTTTEGTNQFLNTRLVAVKPGVVLVAERYSWPMKDLTGWSPLFAKRLEELLPKLAVLAKDAIPISVVNLRSAIQSAEGKETEAQMKLLTIQRLSREPQLFVLERQRMEQLSEEKELKSDESAFWDGSYLLEGTVDQNGYSAAAVTINGRLTPPKGGAPIQFEVSGSRTNLAEIINQLAAKVDEALKVNSSAPAWNAADEAEQYFKEAQWALKWGLYPEAQMASDSAWALGKRDMACAAARVESYVKEVSENIGDYETLDEYYGHQGGYDANGAPIGPPPSEAQIQADIKKMLARHPVMVRYHEIKERKTARTSELVWNEFHTQAVLNETLWRDVVTVHYEFTDKQPDPRSIDGIQHALLLYNEFSRKLPPDEPLVFSKWYYLGIDVLTASSRVLQQFYLVPQSQKPVVAKLADLRSATRSAAEWIGKSPSAYKILWLGHEPQKSHIERWGQTNGVRVLLEARDVGPLLDGEPFPNDLYQAWSSWYWHGSSGKDPQNIYSCKVDWGCFWQEKPEDCVAMYRELMDSPTFEKIRDGLFSRPMLSPRLVAWNEEDNNRVPVVWEHFVQELSASTNLYLQQAGRAFQFRDANGDEDAAAGWAALTPEFQKLDADRQSLQAFDKQKQYLREGKPFNSKDSPQEFTQLFLFGFKDYSKAQATEIRPLLAAFKSNLLAQVESLPDREKGWARLGVMQVGQVEASVDHILNSPTSIPATPPTTQPQPRTETYPSATTATSAPPARTASAVGGANQPEMVANIVAVTRFLPIPMDGLPGDRSYFESDVRIIAHHWYGGRLLLDFGYGAAFYDNNGNWQRTVEVPAIAVLNPSTAQWDVVSCPEADIDSRTSFYHRSALWHGELFNSNGNQLWRYDSDRRQWQVLKISDGNNYELFVVNDHLYAANKATVFEIAGDGNSTRILASTRRNPPLSALDGLDNLGTPVLFEGPNQSLRLCAAGKIFTWTGSDWREVCPIPPTSSLPDIFQDGLLFRGPGIFSASYQNDVISRRRDGSYGTLDSQDTIYFLAKETNAAALYLTSRIPRRYAAQIRFRAVSPLKTFWQMPTNLLPNLPVAVRQSDLFYLEDSFAAHTILNDRLQVFQDDHNASDEYNAVLLCYTKDLPSPLNVYLKFGSTGTPAPTWIFPATSSWLMGGKDAQGRQGVWLLPFSRIAPAIAEQKRIQIAQRAQQAAAEEQRYKALLAKYDRNHNGVIDPEEKEAMLDGPDFITSELDTIDANHNGVLDAEELAYFDANQNKVLDSKEQAGIDIAQHLLAERLFKQFDVRGAGVLQQNEFTNLLQAALSSDAWPMPGAVYAATVLNTNQEHGLKEVETFLQNQTFWKAQMNPTPGQPPFSYRRPPLLGRRGNGGSIGQQESLKSAVEAYWQNPSGPTNWPPRALGINPVNRGANP